MKLKNICIVLILVITCSFSAQAQRAGKKRANKKEKMESLRIAYITEQLDLSTEQWQQFWPVYNKYQDLKQQKRMDRRSDRQEGLKGDAGQQLDEMIRKEEEALKVRKAYIKDLRGVVSDEKVWEYLKIERRFKERLLKKYKGDRKGERKTLEKGAKKEKGI